MDNSQNGGEAIDTDGQMYRTVENLFTVAVLNNYKAIAHWVNSLYGGGKNLPKNEKNNLINRFDYVYDLYGKISDSKPFKTQIVSPKNIFGLGAVLNPDKLGKDVGLKLKLNAGRFSKAGLLSFCFQSLINVGDLSDEEIYDELKKFYTMNNREALKCFGVRIPTYTDRYVNLDFEKYAQLFASSLVLDSLLKDKYSQITSINCIGDGNEFCIKLSDGTEIEAVTRDSDYSEKILRLKKGEKFASVRFDPLTIRDESNYFSEDGATLYLPDIDALDVENVYYSGDLELIAQLQQAMQEQFESQRENGLAENSQVLSIAMKSGRAGLLGNASKKLQIELQRFNKKGIIDKENLE